MADTIDNQRRDVYVKVAYLKIGQIDTVKEEFEADVYIQARWREGSLTASKVSELSDDFTKFWDPEIVIQNLSSSSKSKEWKEFRIGNEGDVYIVEKRRIKGVFVENMELKEFPFDSQQLSIVVTSEVPCSAIVMEEDSQDLSMVERVTFVDEQEWHLRDYVESTFKRLKKEFREDTNAEYPILTFTCEAERRPWFFMWNVILIMTFISLLSFATFAIKNNLPQNRLQLGFTLTLTGVAFRFVTNQSLPKIPYLTQLDKYILFSMIFNFLVCVWHASVSLITDDDVQDTADLWAFISFIILYLLFLTLFYVIVFIKAYKHNQHMKTREQAYQTRAVKILNNGWRAPRSTRNGRKVNPIS